MLVATQVTTITAPLLIQTGCITTDFQGKSGPLPHYLFPFKLISIVADTHSSGCAISIHLWVSVWYLKNRDKNSITSFSKSPQLHTSSMFDWEMQNFNGCQLNRRSLNLARCDHQFFWFTLGGRRWGSEPHTKIKTGQICLTLYLIGHQFVLFVSFCIYFYTYFIHIHTYVFMCKCKSQGLMETKVTQELRYKAWIQLQFLQQATLGKSAKLRCFLISHKFYFIWDIVSSWDINFTFRYLPKLGDSAPPAVRHRKRPPSSLTQKAPYTLKTDWKTFVLYWV